MADDHHHEDRPDYDPEAISLPDKEPPLRSTAPQSDYTGDHVGFGVAVFVVGIAITFGLPLVL